MSNTPEPAAQLLNVGTQRPDYAIVLSHIPAEARYAAFVCNDYDTPSCRSRQAESAAEVSDPFLRDLLASGVSLESLHEQPCPFVHLLACDVPLQGPTQRFPLDQMDKLGVLGINTRGTLGFYPPSPPEADPAVHRYQLRVVFLRKPLGLKQGFSAEELDLALRSVNSEWRVAECHAEMHVMAAQLRQQRSQSSQNP